MLNLNKEMYFNIYIQIALETQQYIKRTKDSFQKVINNYKVAIRDYYDGLVLQNGINVNNQWSQKRYDLEEQWNNRIGNFHKQQDECIKNAEEKYQHYLSNEESNLRVTENCLKSQKLLSIRQKITQSLYREGNFNKEVSELKALSKNDDLLLTIIDVLPESLSNNGLISVENLYQRFDDFTTVAKIYSHTPIESGFGGQMLGRIVNSLLIEPKEESKIIESETPNSVLYRARKSLLKY